MEALRTAAAWERRLLAFAVRGDDERGQAGIHVRKVDLLLTNLRLLMIDVDLLADMTMIYVLLMTVLAHVCAC